MNRTVSDRLLGCLILVFVCQQPGWSENPPATAPVAGACDSPYPDAQGNVTFSCRGLTDEQIRLLPSLSTLVNRLLASNVEGSRLETQTDDILKRLLAAPGAVEKTAPEVTASTHAHASPPIVAPPEKEVILYDYRGHKISSQTGLMAGDPGESAQYQAMLALQRAGEWKKLLKEATREIKKVPDWLTSYAFKAVALQHLGNTQEAIASLEYVDQRSKGNSDYDQVRRLLKQLRPSQP